MEGVVLAPITWVVIALVMVLIDLFLLGLVLLPFAIAAGLIAVLAFVDGTSWLPTITFFSSWTDVALAYGVLSVAGFFVLKGSLRRWSRGHRDVNDY